MSETEEGVVNAFVNDCIRMTLKNQCVPQDIIKIVYSYYVKWRWDKDSNRDNRLDVSSDLLTVTSSSENYIDSLTFTSIFMDHWIEKDGRYYFKLKFHGTCVGSVDEIAIGLVSKKYDIGNKLGIGMFHLLLLENHIE